MSNPFSTTVIINATPSAVWHILTHTDLMPLWMGDKEMNIEVRTQWQIGGSIVIHGFHHVKFENKGTVLQFDKYNRLSYSHLSSLSRLPDLPESYSIIEFVLTSSDQQTTLTLHITNFSTESIRKHLEFYWRTTIFKIKERAE